MCLETTIDNTDEIMPAENHKPVNPTLPKESVILMIVDENFFDLCF